MEVKTELFRLISSKFKDKCFQKTDLFLLSLPQELWAMNLSLCSLLISQLKKIYRDKLYIWVWTMVFYLKWPLDCFKNRRNFHDFLGESKKTRKKENLAHIDFPWKQFKEGNKIKKTFSCAGIWLSSCSSCSPFLTVSRNML